MIGVAANKRRDQAGRKTAMSQALRRLCCIFVGLACLCADAAAGEDAYPSRPVRLIVGFAAGGPTDIPARAVADKLGALIGQPVVVENRPGAAGMLAARYVLAQPNDGHTLLLCTHFESINVAVYKTPQYQLSDLAPVSLIAKYYYGLGLANSVPATDLAGFVSYAKAHPGAISYATLGPGSAQSIFALELQRLTGITMTGVPYRGGALIMQDFVSGRVQFYVSPLIGILPQFEAGQAKILAVSSPERLKAARQIATVKEQGIDFVRFGWLGVCASAGTPAPVIDFLNRHLATVVAAPDYQAMIERAGSIPVSSTPAELRQVIDQTLADVQETVREFGLQQE
jgi:tripartite-type tricarboxylate transporter receptor subunit TctC